MSYLIEIDSASEGTPLILPKYLLELVEVKMTASTSSYLHFEYTIYMFQLFVLRLPFLSCLFLLGSVGWSFLYLLFIYVCSNFIPLIFYSVSPAIIDQLAKWTFRSLFGLTSVPSHRKEEC